MYHIGLKKSRNISNDYQKLHTQPAVFQMTNAPIDDKNIFQVENLFMKQSSHIFFPSPHLQSVVDDDLC